MREVLKQFFYRLFLKPEWLLFANLLKLVTLSFLQNDKIPDEHRENVVNHVVFVHQTVGVYSKTFLQKLRRVNYTTPKNYLDFINTYNKLLEEKDKFVLEQVSFTFTQLSGLWSAITPSLFTVQDARFSTRGKI